MSEKYSKYKNQSLLLKSAIDESELRCIALLEDDIEDVMKKNLKKEIAEDGVLAGIWHEVSQTKIPNKYETYNKKSELFKGEDRSTLLWWGSIAASILLIVGYFFLVPNTQQRSSMETAVHMPEIEISPSSSIVETTNKTPNSNINTSNDKYLNTGSIDLVKAEIANENVLDVTIQENWIESIPSLPRNKTNVVSYNQENLQMSLVAAVHEPQNMSTEMTTDNKGKRYSLKEKIFEEINENLGDNFEIYTDENSNPTGFALVTESFKWINH